jgi:methyl-accepting chemotaxis protein
MSPFFRNSRTAVKLGALALVYLLSFSLYGLYCINTVTEVKINGPHYHRIVQGKDVIADILPPPEYLIESYLAAYRMLHARDARELESLAAEAANLKSIYLERHEYWERLLPEDGLKQAMVRDSYVPALRMLDGIETELIPALRAGDSAKAHAVLEGSIQPAYKRHRLVIDSVVQLAKRRNQEDEARAAVAVDSRIYGQVALGLLLFLLLSVFTSYALQRTEADGREAGLPAPGDAPAPGTRA